MSKDLVLIVSGDENLLKNISQKFFERGYEIETAISANQAINLFDEKKLQLLFLPLK